MSLEELITAEGWEIVVEDGVRLILAEGFKMPFTHPLAIHLKLYRELTHPDSKFKHMKRANDLLWPTKIWHSWTEERFQEHCNGWTFITLAAGASAAKSFDVATIAALFWFANPEKRNVTIASVTQESLATRVWGYLTRLISTTAIPMPYKYYKSPSPKFLYEKEKEKGGRKFKVDDDTLHGIFSVTARVGDDEQTISTWIGKHPDDSMMLVLDEATDMPISILKAIPNLNTKGGRFQMIAIGNSKSRFDLHGSLATPKNGWPSINPMRDSRWITAQKNGICLYSSPYNSPAIHETDPILKEKLGHFLITQEELETKEKELGKDSESFWRFVLGFWKDDGTDKTVMSKRFLDEYDPTKRPHWSGIYPLRIVAGLDPAFSTGGDNCILQLGVIGHSLDGSFKLDLGSGERTFVIKIVPSSTKSSELQVADEVIRILDWVRCPLANLAVDATGQGRALAEVIKLRKNTLDQPFKIYSTQVGGKAVKSFDVIIKSPFEMWMDLRRFIQHNQVCGLDPVSIIQLTTRLIEERTGKFFLESKQKFKTRMGAIMPSLARSPDEADASALCLQAAIMRYGFAPGMRQDVAARPDRSFADSKMDAWKAGMTGGQEHGSEGPTRRIIPVARFSGSLESGASKRGRGF